MIGAIDAGTTSVRFVLVDREGKIKLLARRNLRLDTPHPGWVQQDAHEILEAIKECITEVCQQTTETIEAIGITNQRETLVAWEEADQPRALYPAISWLDTRTADLLAEEIRPRTTSAWLWERTGLPISTYFTAPKIAWLLKQEIEAVDQAMRRRTLRFGTLDAWLIRCLTGVSQTDVSNACRTQLMNITTLEWDPELLKLFAVPACSLPRIRPSAADYGAILEGPLKGVPILGVLGDQQAAVLGHGLLTAGETKLTVGTSSNLLMQTEQTPVFRQGLVTTILYQNAQGKVFYGLEGPMSGGGSLVNWLKRLLGRDDLDGFAESDSAGVFCIPAMAGWLAPRWDPEATGSFLGLTLNTRPGHLVRAVYESIAYSIRMLCELMGVTSLVIDGGLTRSTVFTNILCDTLNQPLYIPDESEMTILGVAWLVGNRIGWWTEPFKHANRSIQPNAAGVAYHEANYQKWLKLLN